MNIIVSTQTDAVGKLNLFTMARSPCSENEWIAYGFWNQNIPIDSKEDAYKQLKRNDSAMIVVCY